MSSVQPSPEYVSRAARLDRILAELLHQTPGVEAASVVSFDGLPMASALPSGMDEDRVAAMSAALLSLAERAAQDLGRGDLSQVYIEGEHGTVFLVSAKDEAVLIAVTAAGAKVGMMLYEVKLAASRVGEALQGPTPLPTPLPAHVTRGYLDAEPTYSEPATESAYTESAYTAPAYTEPVYAEPVYTGGVYGQASYDEPGYDQAGYGATGYGATGYGQAEVDYSELPYTGAAEPAATFDEPAPVERVYRGGYSYRSTYSQPEHVESAGNSQSSASAQTYSEASYIADSTFSGAASDSASDGLISNESASSELIGASIGESQVPVSVENGWPSYSSNATAAPNE